MSDLRTKRSEKVSSKRTTRRSTALSLEVCTSPLASTKVIGSKLLLFCFPIASCRCEMFLELPIRRCPNFVFDDTSQASFLVLVRGLPPPFDRTLQGKGPGHWKCPGTPPVDRSPGRPALGALPTHHQGPPLRLLVTAPCHHGVHSGLPD